MRSWTRSAEESSLTEQQAEQQQKEKQQEEFQDEMDIDDQLFRSEKGQAELV